MSSDRREPPRGERVPPERALARLELRQICLLAVHPMLTAAERQVFGAEHQQALAEARVVLERHATRHEGGVDDVARMFIGLYHVYPNLGLVGPFFDDCHRRQLGCSARAGAHAATARVADGGEAGPPPVVSPTAWR